MEIKFSWMQWRSTEKANAESAKDVFSDRMEQIKAHKFVLVHDKDSEEYILFIFDMMTAHSKTAHLLQSRGYDLLGGGRLRVSTGKRDHIEFEFDSSTMSQEFGSDRPNNWRELIPAVIDQVATDFS